mgnify:CR=1 FL=1
MGNYLEGGADVFAFADDQVSALAAAGGLDPIENEAGLRASSLMDSMDWATSTPRMGLSVLFQVQ